MADSEDNRFTARAARYARVGARVGGVAAQMAGARLTGRSMGDAANAAALTLALGSLKGPLMKVAQFMATIPEALPAEWAEKLQQLQANAPPMGAAFVKRRMQAELGPDWRARFDAFDLHPAHAASLGQVHRATALDGSPLACKLQYPDMRSVVEADLKQLDVLFALRRQFDGAVDTREMAKEIGARVREELDYTREAKHVALYRDILGAGRGEGDVRVPGVRNELSTGPPADARLAGRRAAALLRRRPAGGAQHHRARHVPRLVASVRAARHHPRRSASWKLHGLPRRGRQGGGHQPARLRLHPHLPAEVREGRDRPLPGFARRRRGPASSRPTRSGASATSSPNSWRSSTSGRASSTGRCSTTGSGRSRRASRPASTAASRPSRSTRGSRSGGR